VSATATATVTPVGSNEPDAAEAEVPGACAEVPAEAEALAEACALGVGAIGGRRVGDGAGAQAEITNSAATTATVHDLDIARC
jgi:hypothetical protein